jgi:hypothetical protein
VLGAGCLPLAAATRCQPDTIHKLEIQFFIVEMVSMDSNITKTQETGDYNSKNSNFDNPKIRKTEQSTVNTEQKAGKSGHFTVFHSDFVF